MKQDLEKAAKQTGTTISAIIFQATEELHSELRSLVKAEEARAAASTASAGGLFPRRTVEREPREVKSVIAVRASQDEIQTMDQLARDSGAKDRSFMITLIAKEWLARSTGG